MVFSVVVICNGGSGYNLTMLDLDRLKKIHQAVAEQQREMREMLIGICITSRPRECADAAADQLNSAVDSLNGAIRSLEAGVPKPVVELEHDAKD